MAKPFCVRRQYTSLKALSHGSRHNRTSQRPATGLVGACEGDMDSTLTMLMFAYAFRVPGFITADRIETMLN